MLRNTPSVIGSHIPITSSLKKGLIEQFYENKLKMTSIFVTTQPRGSACRTITLFGVQICCKSNIVRNFREYEGQIVGKKKQK